MAESQVHKFDSRECCGRQGYLTSNRIDPLRVNTDELAGQAHQRINRCVKDGMAAQDAFEACKDHAMALARAHLERFVHRTFREGAQGVPVLETLCSLWDLWRVIVLQMRSGPKPHPSAP